MTMHMVTKPMLTVSMHIGLQSNAMAQHAQECINTDSKQRHTSPKSCTGCLMQPGTSQRFWKKARLPMCCQFLETDVAAKRDCNNNIGGETCPEAKAALRLTSAVQPLPVLQVYCLDVTDVRDAWDLARSFAGCA